MKAGAAPFRILIVDDERAIADSLAMILRIAGYDATAVYSGEAALDAASILGPDIVINDVQLGTINGVEACIHIANKLPACRVIFFTAHPLNNPLIESARAAGYRFEVVAKPISPEKILHILKRDANNARRRA